MKNSITGLKRERDEAIDELERLNTEIERFEEGAVFQKLLESGDASALRMKYKTLNDIIDRGRLPGRECSTWEARTQRRVVVARLKVLEQNGV